METRMHPEIARLIAGSRTADLIAEADAWRLARDAGTGRGSRLRIPFRRLVVGLAARPTKAAPVGNPGC
jgi:hypothetical protein